MKVGVALAQTSWPERRVWSLAEIVEYALRAEALGFDSVWMNDHYFLETETPRRVEGGDPVTLLGHIAGRTERVQLGTLVLCTVFHPVGQLAREARTLAELSGDRFILGLGAGWHEPEFHAFGLPSDRLFSRFKEYVEALVPLLRGERVDYDGRYVKLHEAQVPGTVAPPLWIASRAPRSLELTGTYADGWNFSSSPDQFGEQLEVIREAEAAAGRSHGAVTTSAAATVLLEEREEAERLLTKHPPVLGRTSVGIEGLEEVVEANRARGVDHLILHLSGSIWSSYGLDQLDRAAAALF